MRKKKRKPELDEELKILRKNIGVGKTGQKLRRIGKSSHTKPGPTYPHNSSHLPNTHPYSYSAHTQ